MISELELMSSRYLHAPKIVGKTETEKIDIKLMSNFRYLTRFKAETALNVPFDFKLILIDIELDHIYNLSQAYTTMIKMRQMYTPVPNKITIILGSAGDPMKLSKSSKGVWLFGHRLGHAMFNENIVALYYNKLKQNTKIFKELKNTIRDLYKIYCNSYECCYFSENQKWNKLFKNLSPFQSAKTENVDSNLEYIYELVAQYIMFGKITFNANSVISSYVKDEQLFSSHITALIKDAIENTKGLVLIDR
jgi:hypothetical protein